MNRIAYLCDQKKECNKSPICGFQCKHTEDITHAKNRVRFYPSKKSKFSNIKIENNERMLVEEE